ncbi:hypothetical protein [uncultured Deefgea sp.]|uniref:hypothetical protein n=1 Tax=uncultured Deefgea sp. TaxID=1304914 RepID=UPI00261DE668|nr:hypothetical protein [uncultured Deefgea sp.]
MKPTAASCFAIAKSPQEKLGNYQTAPLLDESFSIIKLQARADEWIFNYHGGTVRAHFEWLFVLARIDILIFHDH